MCGEITGRMVFCCSGNFELGLGHLARCSILAEYLASKGSIYAIRPDPVAESYLRGKAQCYHLIPPGFSETEEAEYLIKAAKEIKAKTIVLDRKDNESEYVGILKEAGLFVLDLEDRGPGRDSADILIDPHIPTGSPEAIYHGSAFCGFGPGWSILHPLYTRLHKRAVLSMRNRREAGPVSEIVISCGGSDPAGLASRVVKALDRRSETFRITVVAGAGARQAYPDCQNHPVRTLHRLDSLARTLCQSDLAFTSGGITMFESLCLGLPTVVLAQHEEQYRNAAKLASQEALLLTPPPEDKAFGIGLEVVLEELLHDGALRLRLSRKGLSLVDGGGLKRLKKAMAQTNTKALSC